MFNWWSSDRLFWIGGGAMAPTAFVVLIWALIGDRSCGRRRCPKCWYDMSMTAAESGLRCPERGKTQKHEKRLFKSHRRWKWAMVSLVIGVLAAFVMVQPKVRRDGWVSIAPTTVVILGLRLPDPTWALDEITHRRGLPAWQRRMVRDMCCTRYQPNDDLSPQTRIDLIVACGGSDEALADSCGDRAVLPTLADQVKFDPVSSVRIAYLSQLAFMQGTDEVSAAMCAFVDDSDDNIRAMAVLTLSFPARTSEVGMNKLIELFASDSQKTRHYAAHAIGTAAKDRPDKARLVQVLVDAYPTEPDEDVRARIVKSLGSARSDPDQIRPVITDALRQESTLMLDAAFEALWECRQLHSLAIDVAMRSVKGEDEDLRESASMFLRMLEPGLLEPYVEELEQLQSSSDESVSEMATRQLDMIRVNARGTGS